MKAHSTLFASAVLALLLSLFIGLRTSMAKADFDRTVQRALQASAGYDKAFIGMVNRLEDKLATRASFGYQGGKDPMTGRIRQVVQQAADRPQGTASAPARSSDAPRTEAERSDPVKLTAIIFDEKNNRYTAIVMDGERSYSLEVGDRVRDRQIRKISDRAILMESDAHFYSYDVDGNSAVKPKSNPGVPQ